MTAADRLTLVAGVVSAIGSGVMGGTMLAFSIGVIPALGRLPASHGITAMQTINVVILGPVFALLFVGTFVANAVLMVGALITGDPGLILGASLYLVGMFGVTGVVNVPLNNALDEVEPDSDDGAALWEHYLTRWTTWNHVRAFACVASATVLTVTLL